MRTTILWVVLLCGCVSQHQGGGVSGYVPILIIMALCAAPAVIKPLRCVFFGHRPAFGYGRSEGRGYFEVRVGEIDGIGRVHARLYCKCERCGERYQVGMIHVPDKNPCPHRDGHCYTVSSPIDSVEVCMYCGAMRACEPHVRDWQFEHRKLDQI